MTTRSHDLTPLAVAVLKLLRERDMHPYEMHQTIRDRATDRVIKVTPGTLYHTVERLNRGGLITAVETARAGRRPERTVYTITDEGHDEFRRNLREMIRYPRPEYAVFAAAMEMAHALEPTEVARLLEQRAVSLEAALAAHDQVTAGLIKRGLTRLQLIEIEYIQAMTRAELRWIGEVIDDVRSGELSWTRPRGGVFCPTDPQQETPS